MPPRPASASIRQPAMWSPSRTSGIAIDCGTRSFASVRRPMQDTAARLRAAVEGDAQRIRADLERLVAIPSVAFDGFPPEPLAQAADAVEQLLREAGGQYVRGVAVPGDPPSIYAEWAGPPQA